MKLLASILDRTVQISSVICLMIFSTLTVGVIFGICILIVSSIGADIRIHPVEISFAKLYLGTFLGAVWYPLCLLLIVKSIRFLIITVRWAIPWAYYESKDLIEIYHDTKFNSIDFMIRYFRKSFNRTRLFAHWIEYELDYRIKKMSTYTYDAIIMASKAFNILIASVMGITLIDIIVVKSIYTKPTIVHLILAILVGFCMLRTSKWIYNNITR